MIIRLLEKNFKDTFSCSVGEQNNNVRVVGNELSIENLGRTEHP